MACGCNKTGAQLAQEWQQQNDAQKKETPLGTIGPNTVQDLNRANRFLARLANLVK